MGSVSQAVGQKIRAYRVQKKMTQEELAERADLHHTYIGQVERGEKSLTLNSLEKILDALNVSFPELFEEFGPKERRDSIPARCYDLVNRQSEADQKRLYQILCEIELLIHP